MFFFRYRLAILTIVQDEYNYANRSSCVVTRLYTAVQNCDRSVCLSVYRQVASCVTSWLYNAQITRRRSWTIVERSCYIARLQLIYEPHRQYSISGAARCSSGIHGDTHASCTHVGVALPHHGNVASLRYTHNILASGGGYRNCCKIWGGGAIKSVQRVGKGFFRSQ